MKKTYRSSFAKQSSVTEYLGRYSNTTLSSYLFELEKLILKDIVSNVKIKNPIKTKYLDYACGSGRVLKFIIDELNGGGTNVCAFGMDVSQEMLNSIGEIPAQLIKIDVSKENYPEHDFNLITCFRFFLHSEHELRVSILKSLHKMLEYDGLLVVNNHGSCRSFLGLMRLLSSKGHCMSDSDFSALICEAGFKIEKIYSFGLFPGIIVNLRIFRSIMLSVERLIVKRGWSKHQLGIQKIYICRKI